MTSDAIEAYWRDCQAALPDQDLSGGYIVKRFTINKAMAKQLLKLVVEREKTGTVSMPWEFEDKPEAMPREGMLWLAVDGDGNPGALLRLTQVETIPYNEITEEQTACESAPARPLEAWRRIHWTYWNKLAAELGKEDRISETMPVICQRFEVLYPPPPAG